MCSRVSFLVAENKLKSNGHHWTGAAQTDKFGTLCRLQSADAASEAMVDGLLHDAWHFCADCERLLHSDMWFRG